jgi:hypothetical protein
VRVAHSFVENGFPTLWSRYRTPRMAARSASKRFVEAIHIGRICALHVLTSRVSRTSEITEEVPPGVLGCAVERAVYSVQVDRD